MYPERDGAEDRTPAEKESRAGGGVHQTAASTPPEHPLQRDVTVRSRHLRGPCTPAGNRGMLYLSLRQKSRIGD